jgi:hypothetical protein
MRQKQAEKLEAGREYRLVCETAGSKPPAVLKWIKGGKEITQVSTQVSLSSFITERKDGEEIEYFKSDHHHHHSIIHFTLLHRGEWKEGKFACIEIQRAATTLACMI